MTVPFVFSRPVRLDIIHDDLDTILKDLREHHRSDALTADEYTVIDKFNKTLKEMKGSPDKGLALLIHWFYSALGIREGSLTDDEKASFESILKKSKLLQTGFASRGRYKKRHKDNHRTKGHGQTIPFGLTQVPLSR